MKQNKLDEQWLDEIRQTMADHEEELPADGWEKIAAAMAAAEEVQPKVAPKQTRQPRVIPLWLSRAAAAIVLGAIGTASIYYFYDAPTSTADPNLTAEQHTQTVTPPTTTVVGDSATMLQAETTPLLANARPIVQRQRPAAQRYDRPTSAEQPTSEATASATTVSPEASSPAAQTQTELISYPKKTDKQLPDIRTEEQAVLLAMETASDRSNSSVRSWSMGLRLGGNGSKNSDITSNEVLSDQNPEYSFPFIPDSISHNTKSPAMTRGTYPAPEDEVLDSENHLSWSAGISVSKQLNERLSLESGLVYTYLSSDVKMSLSGRQHQQLHYLGIPLKLNLTLTQSTHWQFYASAGTMLEHSLYGKRGKTDLHLNDWQWSMNGGLGLQRQLTHHMGLYLEPGINYYFDNGTEVPSLRTASPFSFNLQIGVRLGL